MTLSLGSSPSFAQSSCSKAVAQQLCWVPVRPVPVEPALSAEMLTSKLAAVDAERDLLAKLLSASSCADARAVAAKGGRPDVALQLSSLCSGQH